MRDQERRDSTGTVERRATGDGQPVAAGYAAVFGRRSVDLGGFTELIDRAAFTKTVSEADVLGLWDHDERSLLGRIASATLRLDIDDRGLAYEIDLPDTSTGRDVAELLRRGDIRGSSFGFRTIRDEWFQSDEGEVTRTLLEVALIDVSPVSRPAYADTTVALRSLAQATGRDLTEVRTAAERRSLGVLFGDTHEGREEPTVVRRHQSHLYV